MPNAQPSDYLFELQQPLSAKLIGSTNPDENNTMITQIKRVSFNYSDKTSWGWAGPSSAKIEVEDETELFSKLVT